jgi:hypothetical protein
VVIEPDWPNMLVDRGENKVTSFKLAKYDSAVHSWELGIVVFIDRDADMNNSRGRTRIYPSAGLRDTCLSR